MQQRKTLNRTMSIAALAMLFGAGSAWAQDATSRDAAGMTEQNRTGQMSPTGQNETTSASPDTSGAPDATGAAGSAGASGSSGASGGMEQGASGSSAEQSSGASAASSGAAGSGAGATTLSKADQNIMREIAQANMAEVRAATIALQKSDTDQVKTFAQKMIDDHTQAQQELEQLAQSKGVTLPTELDRKNQAMAKKLESLEGAKFDKQYLSQGGVKDHRETHRMLNRAETRASDPELKALITKIEPVVSNHMQMAQDIQSGKGTASGASDSSGTSGAPGSGDSSGMPSGGASGSTGGSSASGASGSSEAYGAGSANSTDRDK